MRRIVREPARIIGALLGIAAVVFLISGCEEEDGAKGYALAIGLNSVDPAHYGGWDGQLYGCEPDAKDMETIAVGQDLETETLLTAQATRQAVLDKLDELAGMLAPGELLVVSYSGHGGQVPDSNGDEDDGLDETWCLYDGQLIDDELHGAWMKFKEGVRILVFSDSCHSGTVVKAARVDLENPAPGRIEELETRWKGLRVPPQLDREAVLSSPEFRDALKKRDDLRMRIERLPRSAPTPDEEAGPMPAPVEAEEVFLSRAMPPGVMRTTYEQNRADYESWGKAAAKESDPVKAAVILISGCEDAQLSADLGFNGLFTYELVRVWDGGNFTGSHEAFRNEIKDRVVKRNPDQEPYLFKIGTGPEAFAQERPYTVK